MYITELRCGQCTPLIYYFTCRGIYLRKSVPAKLIFTILLILCWHAYIFFALPAYTGTSVMLLILYHLPSPPSSFISSIYLPIPLLPLPIHLLHLSPSSFPSIYISSCCSSTSSHSTSLSPPCRPFLENYAAQAIYFFKGWYFVLSAFQIISGYPYRILGYVWGKTPSYISGLVLQG